MREGAGGNSEQCLEHYVEGQHLSEIRSECPVDTLKLPRKPATPVKPPEQEVAGILALLRYKEPEASPLFLF